MCYGVARFTDMRCPITQIKKFTSKKSLQKWLATNSGNYRYSDAARNYHRSFRNVYELHGRIDKTHPFLRIVDHTIFIIFVNTAQK